MFTFLQDRKDSSRIPICYGVMAFDVMCFDYDDEFTLFEESFGL